MIHPLLFLGLLPVPQEAPRPAGATEPHLALPAAERRIVWGDSDGDGRAEAFAILPSGAGALLRCGPDRTLVDVTEGSGLELAGAIRRATWIDVDADGADELFLFGSHGARLWRSHGGTSFEDVTEAVGLVCDETVTSAAWIELDGDGLPDLHVTTDGGDRLYWSSPSGVFMGVDVQLPATETPRHGAFAVVDSTEAGALDEGSPTAGEGETRTGGTTREVVLVDEPGDPDAPVTGSSTTSASSSLSSPSPAGPEASSSVCLQSITDQATAACLMASSIPTMGMLYPLGPELFIDSVTDNVGIGTTDPDHRLEVITAVSGGTAVRAASGSTTGVGQGVWGSSASPLGKGVLGIATNPSGVTTGVLGQAHSDQGQGVLGQSLGATGSTVGVRGLASSPDGIGVRGEHPATTGTAPGVLGETASAEHDASAVLGRTTAAPALDDATYAVRGEAQATTGTAMGVAGSSVSADGVGVWGTTATGGLGGYLKGAGVVGSTDVDSAAGAAGYDLSTAGGSGVLGSSASGNGVEGSTTSTNAGDAGVLGRFTGTDLFDQVAVRGESLPAPFWGIGGHFEGGYIGVQGRSDLPGTGNRVGGRFIATNGDDGNTAVVASAFTFSPQPTFAVHGSATTVGSEAYGAFLSAGGETAVGVHARGTGTTATGVRGISDSTTDAASFGVVGESEDPDPGSAGVWGEYTGATASDAAGVVGVNDADAWFGFGGIFRGGFTGVLGSATAAGLGARYGGYFTADGGIASNYGVYASGTTNAGYFDGDVAVTGSLSKGGGSFKIDHPLDPENRYLYHSFVESPDMMNVYNGNVVLDGSGEAWVEMPEWFEALNRDFRYQLTCLGSFAPVYIGEEIRDNRFRIAGGTPGLTVSWTVTGIRHDPWAEANRIPVVEPKPDVERGSYLHPRAYGLGAERSASAAVHERALESAARSAASAGPASALPTPDPDPKRTAGAR